MNSTHIHYVELTYNGISIIQRNSCAIPVEDLSDETIYYLLNPNMDHIRAIDIPDHVRTAAAYVWLQRFSNDVGAIRSYHNAIAITRLAEYIVESASTIPPPADSTAVDPSGIRIMIPSVKANSR